MRHRWVAIVPYEVTPEDALRMVGLLETAGADLPDTQLAADQAPVAEDERPFLGLHNIVRDLATVGCFECEQAVTPENANADDCPGSPDGRTYMPRAEDPTAVKVDLGGVGRNDPCPCGSGLKFKRCHGAGR